jgi:polysaccharide chain length determinant protein (PEP-CTERM system associated)
MTPHTNNLGDLLSLLYKEGKRRILLLSILFSVVALAMLVVGMLTPKRYDAQTVLQVDSANIIKPLMEGRAMPTGVSDRASVVNEVISRKSILREILKSGGWLNPPPTPQEEERKMQRLRARIRIDSPREELIRILYHDTDPLRAQRLTNEIAQIYLRESRGAKERESREAFEFIDKQVRDYGDKLAVAHEKVLAYYRGQEPALTPEAPTAAPSPSPVKRLPADQLAALRAEEASLTAQLGRNRPASQNPQETRQAEDHHRNRLAQLQSELDRLLAAYTDQHPDVKRVRREITTVQDQLKGAERARIDRERAAAATSALDDEVERAARARLAEVQRRISAATGVVRRPRPIAAVGRAVPDERTDPEMRGVGQDTTLSELLRRYESTRDIYQDLLKRRENARVSMTLDAENIGLTARVLEPADVPVNPTGLRLMHFCMAGMALALLLPLGILFALVRFDPRVRSAQQIERLARVPLLVSIPYKPAPKDIAQQRTRMLLVGLIFASVFAAYGFVFLMKLKTAS